MNPLQTLGRYTNPVMPQKRIRCLVGNWYVGKGGEVAAEGRTYLIDSDVARALVQQQRAEHAQ